MDIIKNRLDIGNEEGGHVNKDGGGKNEFKFSLLIE